VADAHNPNARNASAAVTKPGADQSWASKTGRKIKVFFAHWCSRIAFSQAFSGLARSTKTCTGVTPAARKPAVNPAVGFATMGSIQRVKAGISGVALPMYEN
jgi:hypothetical protein